MICVTFFTNYSFFHSLQAQTIQGAFTHKYIQELTTGAILLDEKMTVLDQIWPLMFIEMVQDAVYQMQDTNAHMANVLNKLDKRK